MPPLFPSSSRPGTTHPHDRVTTQGYPSGRRRTFGLMTLARVRGRCHTWPPQPFFFHVVGQIPVDPGSISSSFSALQLLISLARTSWAIFLAANIKDGQTASNSSSTTTIAPLQIPDPIMDHMELEAGRRNSMPSIEETASDSTQKRLASRQLTALNYEQEPMIHSRTPLFER